jgi:hypothetical protein
MRKRKKAPLKDKPWWSLTKAPGSPRTMLRAALALATFHGLLGALWALLGVSLWMVLVWLLGCLPYLFSAWVWWRLEAGKREK